MPNTPYNQQIANCCTGGVMASMGKDPSAALSAFQISVGSAGNTNTTVKLPKNFTLVAPGGGYTCGPAKIIRPTRFVTNDGLRVTQAMKSHILMQAGPKGNVHSDLTLEKDGKTIALSLCDAIS
ncbi:hypothetical protein MTR67_015073 [Solanum verrucosum]|uniref:Uncharacterized protein n=1 Tax=Solanum verrucosum TaxID=315347 RepID=A0AAF0QEI8_SOLVR|nr:hypothetical protein MTR67_015073 [Solanum verrucosum]